MSKVISIHDAKIKTVAVGIKAMTISDKQVEEWVPVQGHEGAYEVSNHGGVRSLDREMDHGFAGRRLRRGRILKAFTDKDGYRQVALGAQGKVKVHRLVAIHFIPNPENLPQVNHIDFNKTNNAVRNLEWVTGAGNTHHAREAGRMHAATNPDRWHKLSEADIAAIRERVAAGERQRSVASDFGVSAALVCLIVNGKCRVSLPQLFVAV